MVHKLVPLLHGFCTMLGFNMNALRVKPFNDYAIGDKMDAVRCATSRHKEIP